MPEIFPVARVRTDPVAFQQARRMFFEEGRAPATLVPETIIESWRRCQSRGQSASDTPDITPVTVHELNALLERNEGLRRVCRPEMEALGALAKATQSVLILTDPDGLVLETLGDMQFSSRAAAVSLRPGTLWSEANSGTNAIGTALVRGTGVVVRGGEHFHAPHGILSCAATPIYDPHGAMIGVLDLTGPAAQAHPHTLGLVEMAVSQIEHRQFDQGFEGADVMVLSREAGLLGTPREGVLVFEGQKLVAASRTGLTLTGLDYSALGSMSEEDIFRESPARGPGEMSLRGRANGRLFARFRARLPRMVRGARLGGEPVMIIRDKAFSQGLARGLAWLGAGLNLFISGESGTGKSTLVEALHAGFSPQTPLIRVDCARTDHQALAASLSEAEQALVAKADVMLVLEEVTALPASHQSRLAACLSQAGSLAQAGSGLARVVATTVHAITPEGTLGKLRPDILHALAQGRIELAPLHARPDLAETIRTRLMDRAVDDEVIEVFLAHGWPGNLREFDGVLRAMMALADPDETLTRVHLPDHLSRKPATDKEPAADLNSLTLSAMQAALEAAGGNVSRAARQLGVDRTTLYRRLLWKGRPPTPV